MSDFCDYSKLLDTNYSQQIFRAADNFFSKPNVAEGIHTFCETMPSLDETSYALKLTLRNFVGNSDVSIPIIFTDDSVFFEVNMLIQLRDNYEITKFNAELLEELSAKLLENRSVTNFKKCFIKPIYTSPMHVQISRKFEKTTSFEEDVELLCNMCMEMLALPISFYKTVEKRINPQANTSSNTSSESGCYIATCVYGSYDCPQVWTLRRYRDNTLATTWYGKAFIRTYYAISPTLVKWFGHTNWFKKLWVGTLNKMVENLQSNGVESTPYEDKRW